MNSYCTIKRLAVIVGAGLGLFLVGIVSREGPSDANAAMALPAPCILGDGYKIASGGNLIVYPVRCPSNCFDFPNGGLDTQLFCKDGVLGISDPTLTKDGTVAPYEVAAQYNGYSRCTALPQFHPWPNQPKWGQSADRKTCVKL